METQETKAINAVAFSVSRTRMAAGWIEIECPVKFNEAEYFNPSVETGAPSMVDGMVDTRGNNCGILFKNVGTSVIISSREASRDAFIS